MYAEHARSGTSTSVVQNLVPSLDDVRLAVQARSEGASVPKEVSRLLLSSVSLYLADQRGMQFLLQLATQVNAIPLPAVPEVYGIRLPPQAARLTAPNFSLVPRSSTLDAFSTDNISGGLEPSAPPSGGESDEGLFGDDVEGEDDDEDDDEEMEDVTGGDGGAMSGGREGKRKAESENEDYD